MAIAPSDHIVFRDTKGSPLTSVEGDQNLDFLNRTKQDKVVLTPTLTTDAVNKAYSDASRIGKNFLDNADMVFSQRGPTAQLSGTVNAYGGPDRYGATNATLGGSFSQSQQGITINGVGKIACSQNVGTGIASLPTTGYWSGIRQGIEGCRVAHIGSQGTVFGFWFQSSTNGNHSLSIRLVGANSYSFTTLFSYTGSGTPQFIIIVIPPPPANSVSGFPSSTAQLCNVWIDALSLQSSLMCPTASLGAWQSGQQYISAQGGVNWAATSGNYIAVSEPQWELGSVPSTFERLTFAQNAMQCYRFFYRLGSSNVSSSGGYWDQPTIGVATVLSTTDCRGSIVVPVPMRALPTLSLTQGQILLRQGTSGIGTSASVGAMAGNNIYIVMSASQSAYAPSQLVMLGMYNTTGQTLVDFSADF
jgi:hypothetical protein